MDEFFEFIKNGEVFSLTTYDEIITYEIKQENERLKDKLRGLKDDPTTEFKLDPILSTGRFNNTNNPNNLNNINKNKYDDDDTAFKVREVTKGLSGLNTGNKKKDSVIISKKALDD